MHTHQQITIRGVDDTTKQRLLAHARQRGLSLNAYNLELLKQDAGTQSTATTNGLERFSGIAPLDDAVEQALQDQRQPRPDKWDSHGVY